MALSREDRDVKRRQALAAWHMRKIQQLGYRQIGIRFGASGAKAAWDCGYRLSQRGRQHALTLALAEIGCDHRVSPSLRSATRPKRIRGDWLEDAA